MAEINNPASDDNGGQGQAPAQSTQPPTGNAPGQESGKVVFESEDELQKEINRRLGARLAKEREKYADYDQLKAAADKLKTLEEAQLSEQEKLQKRLAELEQKAAQAQAKVRETSIKSAVIAEAARLGFNDPSDAYRLIDLAAVELDDNGEVKNASELVKTLAEQRKYLVKSGQSLAPFNPDGEPGKLRETDAQKRARIYGAHENVWDGPGGGVVWPKDTPE